MNIERARDAGHSGPIIVKPRVKAETARRSTQAFKRPADDGSQLLLATGCAIGAASVTGFARYISSARDLESFRPGEILMANVTTPEWEAAMASAAAIITNQGGPTSHAAVMARQLGVPAIVGSIDGASRLWTGAVLTVACSDDGVGRVYERLFQYEVSAKRG